MEIESPNKRRFWQLKPGGYHNPKGFTLLEVLIVISILAILTTVGIGYYRNVVKSNEVELAAKSIANDLKVAKAKAIAGEGNLRWGIHFVDGVDDYYEIFSTPTDYNDPAKVVIQTVYLPKGVNLTGTPADIIFDKITGNPLAAAEVVINNEGYTASVEVSALGNLKVNKGPRAKDLPGAPTSLNAVAGLGQVNLTWTAPSQQGTTAINNYKIYRGLTSNSQTFYANAGNTTSYNDTGSGPADQPFGTNGVVTGATASQYAYAMAKDSTYMYVAGSNDSSAWRIEKRLLSTGALDNGFGTSGVVTGPSISYIAYSITIDSTYMYVAGANDNNAWRIEKRLLSTGALDNNFGTSGVITGVTLSAAARAITIDSTYMYVAGYNENADLRIEKRLLSTGALDNGFGTSGVITGASSSNGAYAIAKDSTYMYLGGYNDSFDWRIEKRLLSTGAVDNGFGTSGVITGNFLSSVAYAIAIDSTYMYVAGYNDSFDWRIEKRLLSTGALDSNFGTSGVVTGASLSSAAYSIAIDSTYMYVAGYDGNTDWRIEKRLLSTGAVDNGFGTSGVVTGASLSSTAIPTAIDSTYMYVAGYDGNSDWRIEKRKLSDGALFSPVLGVDGGTTYYYRVSAENTLGEGPQSNVANATPTSSVPAAPTNLVATPGSTQVSLTWTAAFPNGNQITNYKVYQYSSGCTSVLNTYTIGNTTSYTNTGLTNGLGYCYKVSAVNGLGEGAMSSSVTATPAVLPGAPTGLSGTPGNQQVTLNWSAPASDGGSAITNYKIYSSTTAGQETLLTTVGNVLTYDNTSLTGGITYYYKVSAVNPIGEGAQSSETSATPTNQTIPGAPTGLAVTPGTGQLTLNWSAPSSDGGSAITNYKIYRGTSASGETFYSNNASNIAVNTLSPNGSTSSSATSFSLQRKTFYDSSNSKYWAFYNNGTAIAYYNSTTGDGGGGGGSTWTSRGTTGVATSNFAVWYVPGTSTVYLTYLSSGIKVVKGTLGSTSISWGTVYSANADTLANEVSISRDSNGRLWVGAHASNASTNNTYVIRSTNIDDPSAWGATQTILSGTNLNGPMAFNLTMVPMTSANMYFVYEYSPDAVNNFYIKGMKWNDATSSLGSQDAIDTISAVGVADYGTLSSVSDSSGNVYALYETCSTSCKGPVKFAKYTGSWQTPVTIDSNTTNGSLSLSIDTATGDLYGFWIRANTIYYSKGVSPYVGANWTTPASLISTGTNAYLTSGYQAGSNGYIPMIWTEGTGSLYNIKFFGQATPGATGTATSFVDTGVNNGTTYYYKVSAVNVAGEGAQSNEASGSPNSAPGAPTGLAATPGDGQATLNWSAPASNGGSAITNYNVYRGTSANGETLLTTLGNVTNYTDTGPAGFGTGGVITGAAASIASYAIAKDSTYMYVVGQDATPDWRIEKRLLSTGALDPGFGTSGVVTSPAASDIAYAIAIDSTYMYVGGYDSGTLSRIEKRLLTTGALDNSFGTSGVVTGAAASWGVRTIAIDSTYMYIGGLDGNVDWRIEKRLLSTGALDNGFGTSGIVTGVTLTYSIRAITIDSTYMYVAGYDANLDWRIEKRLLTTGAVDNGFGTSGVVTSAAASQYAYAIAKDATYMYVAGQDVTNDWRIEKRLLSTGAVDNAFGTSGVVTSAAASYVAQAISIDASYMYVVGSEGANTGPYDWRIEKRLLSTGAVDNAFGTSGVVTSAAASNIAWAITIDSTNMYVAGDDGADSRIEKRLLTNGNLDTSGLTNGTTYYYKVSAVNAIGEGSQSNEASGTPQAVLNRATFYLQQDDSEVAGCPGCFNTMTLGYPTFAGSDVVNAADTIISYNGSNPCEGTSVNSGTTQIQVDMDGVITEACIAAFYTPVLGTTTTLTTSQTNSISTRFSAGRPSASNNGTVIPKVHLFRYDGASYVEFAILTGTALGTTVASQTVTGTPSINIDIRPTDRIVASYTGNITSGDTSTQTDYFQFNLNDTANPAYVFFQNLSVTTASRPDLTGSKDDDFITYQAETNCTNAGVAYNTKWTCTTPSGTTLGKFKAHHHPSAATIGDATSWLTMEDTEDATLGTNFSASPENTYLWEAVDTNANGNGNISTVINMATRANASMGNPKHHGGLLLWASNTDYLEVQISFDALGQNHVVEVNQNGFLWGTTTLSSNLVWLRWNKVGSIYTPQYSMDGSTWTSIAAGISHPTTFTRTGLTVYTSQTSGHAGAAFEYFDYDLSGSSSIYDQTAYRFYNNVDSSTSVGTPLAANNTPATAPAQGTNFRLRTLLHTTAAISAGNDTFTKLGNPDVLPAGAAQSVCFSPDSKYLAVGVGTSPFITLYKRVGDTFVKLADPTALAGTGWECSWTPDSKYLALGNSNSPFITIYKNNFNDTFTKLGNPSVLPPRPCNDAHFSPDGKYLACTFDTTSPFIYMYRNNNDDTFTKLADLSALAGAGWNTDWSGDGKYVVAGVSSNTTVNVYQNNFNDTFTALPSLTADGQLEGHGYSPDGEYVGGGAGLTPFVNVWKQNKTTGAFTKLSSSAFDFLPPSEGWNGTLSWDGTYLAVVSNATSPYLTVYKRSGDTFNRVTISSAPASGTTDNTFSPDGNYLAISHSTSPYLSVFKENRIYFKLQYAVKGGGTCASPTGTYTDMSMGNGDLRLADNPTPVEGTAISSTVNDPTDGYTKVAQTYQENNPFGVTTSIPAGQSAMWDFALVDYGATGSTYCLRMVQGNGSQTLDTYTQYPEITTATPPVFGTGGVITGATASTYAEAVAKDSTYMYVVGENSSINWRIEKRLLSTGDVDSGFGTSGVVSGVTATDKALGIAIDSTYMYVVGNNSSGTWRIEKRNLSDGALVSGFGTSGVVTGAADTIEAEDIAIDSTYMYVAGNSATGGGHIEKRNLSDGALVSGFGTSGVFNDSSTSDYLNIVIDSTYAYATGFNTTPDWRMAKLLLTTGAVDSGFGTSGFITGAAASTHAEAVATDSTYMYVAGSDTSGARIEKRLLTTGALVSGFGTSGVFTEASFTPFTLAIDGTYMYAAGWDGADSRIEKRLLTTGAVDSGFGTSGIITGPTITYVDQDIVNDSRYMYVVGYDATSDWRIEKRDIATGTLAGPPTFGTGGVQWSDPTTGSDQLNDMAIDSSNIYTAGYQTGGCALFQECWRIEKRNIGTGALVTAFDTDGIVQSDPTSLVDKTNAIAIDANYIYVGGEQGNGGACSAGLSCWRLEKRDITTGALVTAFDGDGIVNGDFSANTESILSVAVDSSYVYTAGYDGTNGNVMRIEKRNKTTGALVTAFDTDGIVQSIVGDIIYDIAIDSTYIYAVGSESGAGCTSGSFCWRYEKRDITTGALVTAFDSDGAVTIDPSTGFDWIYSVAIDSSYIYAGGFQTAGCPVGLECWRYEKRDITTGALVTAFDSDGILQSDPTSGTTERIYTLAIDSNYLYAGGYQNNGSGCTTGLGCWRLEKRNITTGALVIAFDGDGIVQVDPTLSVEQINAIVTDSSYLYVGGYQGDSSGCDTGSSCWRLEKRDITTGALVP